MIAAGRSLLHARPLLVCCLLALALRLPLAIWGQNFIAPDEVAQYFGQAHRLVYGQGPVAWEYQVGLRSWLLPGMVAGPMEMAKLAGLSPYAGVVLVRVLLCFASLSLVWSGFVWGRMAQGLRGGLIAGGLAAIWPDLWLMAPHPLEEALAAYCLVPAACLASLPRQTGRLLLAGWLLGMSFIFREALAPGIAIIGIILCGRKLQHWAIAVGAATLPVLFAGGLDWVTWGQPFRSFWLNVYLNPIIGHGDSGLFLPTPLLRYILDMTVDWLWATPFLALFAWRGAKLSPPAALAALALLLEHSLISHKEFRFIFPAIALLVPLAGVGFALSFCAALPWRPLLAGLALLSGPLLSPRLPESVTAQRRQFALYDALAHRHPCLVADSLPISFIPMAMLFTTTRFTDSEGMSQADAIIGANGFTHVPAGFRQSICITRDPDASSPTNPRLCSWTREQGWCDQTSPAPPLHLIFPPEARAFQIISPGSGPPQAGPP